MVKLKHIKSGKPYNVDQETAKKMRSLWPGAFKADNGTPVKAVVLSPDTAKEVEHAQEVEVLTKAVTDQEAVVSDLEEKKKTASAEDKAQLSKDISIAKAVLKTAKKALEAKTKKNN